MFNAEEWKELKRWLREKAAASDLTRSELKDLANWLFKRKPEDEPEDDNSSGDGFPALEKWVQERAKTSDLTEAELKELTTWLFSRKDPEKKD